MLETAEGFLCLLGPAFGMSAGHTSGFQLGGAQTLVVLSLNIRAGAQGTSSIHVLSFCKLHNNCVVETGSSVQLDL